VDQVEVDVIHLELVEAGLERPRRGVIAMVGVEALRRDEELGAVQPRRADGLADLRLVAVGLGGVDVAVADLDRGQDVPGRLLRRDLEDADAELGDGDVVGEGDAGDLDA
jgi:hypothetical protein